ncbi:MAG: DMT family transporter [Spirochaetaceae bacterium]|nr:DMT family transporter [Spirochaetaceae bacterium]
MLPNLLIGQILAIIAALTYAENSIIYSYLGKKVSIRASVHVRLWIAAPIIILIAFVSEGNFFVQATLSNWVILLLSGLLGYFFCDSLLFWAFTNIGPREALVIMTLNPIFSTILSYFFFKEVLTILQMFAILITLSGIVILILNQKKEDDISKKRNLIKGTIFAFLASILQAISNILAKSALSDLGPLSTNSIRMIGGLTGAVLFSLFIRKEFKNDFIIFKNKKDLSLLLIASISGPVIGMSFLLTAFNYSPVGVVTAIVQISPIFILLYELIFKKKYVKMLGILGTIISVVGVALMFL